jgi:hypothetical protein
VNIERRRVFWGEQQLGQGVPDLPVLQRHRTTIFGH